MNLGGIKYSMNRKIKEMNDRFRRFCYHIPEVKRYPTHLHCGLNGFPSVYAERFESVNTFL